MKSPLTSKFKNLAVAMFATFTLTTSLAFAQFGASSSSGSGQPLFGGGATPSSMPAQMPFADGSVPSLANAIDTNDYLIGSGDVFFITVVGSPTVRHTATVDPSGRLLINNVGAIDIGRMPYRDAKRVIAENVALTLRRPSEVYVTLTQLKNVTVAFTGSIAAPGAFSFSGDTRLLDAIRTANGGEHLPASEHGNLREITITNGDSVVTYDLLAYLYNGDASQNPYLYPGDRIRIAPTTRRVTISGAVISPAAATYPLKENETLGDFLKMFTLGNTADPDNIIIFQSSNNSRRTLARAEHDNYTLNDNDVITVPVMENFQSAHSVSIGGEIARPGHYSITENTVSARQLVDMAGGVRETGNFAQAVVIRPARNLPDRFIGGAGAMNAVRPERGSSVSMATASLDYTVIRLALYNADEVILEPGDRVYIPKRDPFVYISGAVRNPGAYRFRHGRDTDHYIKLAGGLARNADRPNIQVVMKYGDIIQTVDPQCIDMGAVIVVPTSIQHRYYTQVLLPTLSTIAAILTAVAVIYPVATGN